jgi:hypothetical protein
MRRSPKPDRCPRCGSDCVTAWWSDDLDDGIRARMVLLCAECGTSRRLVVTVWAVEAYERRLDRHRRRIAAALARLDGDHPDRLTSQRGRLDVS